MTVAGKIRLGILAMKILQHIATKNSCSNMIILNCTDCKMGETIGASFCRSIENLPVNESAIAGKADAAPPAKNPR